MWHNMCSWSDGTEESMEIIPRDNLLENFNGFGNFGAVFQKLYIMKVEVEDVPVP